MWSYPIVEVQIVIERRAGFRHAGVGTQIDLLVLHRFPNPFDKFVVWPCPVRRGSDLEVLARADELKRNNVRDDPRQVKRGSASFDGLP